MKRGYLIWVLVALTSCEGFKVVVLTNVSGDGATVKIKPKDEILDRGKMSNYPSEEMGDSVVITLPNEESLVLSSTFTTMIFGSKIKPYDLRIHYLEIVTKKRTITADSKEKILRLLDDPATRYDPKQDKPMNNGKNFGNIMIR